MCTVTMSVSELSYAQSEDRSQATSFLLRLTEDRDRDGFKPGLRNTRFHCSGPPTSKASVMAASRADRPRQPHSQRRRAPSTAHAAEERF
jgi:hypothetical protein